MVQKLGPAEMMRRSRVEAMRYASKTGTEALSKLLNKAQHDLDLRLSSALKGADDSSFTVEQVRVVKAQVGQLLHDLEHGMKATILDAGKQAGNAATSSTLDYLERAEKKFHGIAATLPLHHASMFDRVAKKLDASILRRLSMSEVGFKDPKKARKVKKGILQRYGENVIRKFEDRLMLAVATKKRLRDVREELKADSPFLKQSPAHWAERIVRTETMAAYNAAGLESNRLANEQLGDMVKILCATFDSRTSWDSYAVHGQIRRPDEPFEDSDGRLYMYPPNRPNDREIVVPHRISWPLPDSLQPKSDSEVNARYREERPKGPGPGPRPNMSTVPRELFGHQIET